MTTQSKSLRLADSLVRSPYTSLGGYPLFAITSDGGCLCHKCCKVEREAIATTTGTDGWNVIAVEVNYESELWCDNCSDQIESAYGV